MRRARTRAAGNKNMEVFLPAQTASGRRNVVSTVVIRPCEAAFFATFFRR